MVSVDYGCVKNRVSCQSIVFLSSDDLPILMGWRKAFAHGATERHSKRVRVFIPDLQIMRGGWVYCKLRIVVRTS